MYITTTGIVLRETIYKETSKMLTVLTASHGKIGVLAKGCRRRGSKIGSAAQLLTYSEMTLYSSKTGWILTEAFPTEQFTGLRDNIESLSLGSYFAEMAEQIADEDEPNAEILSLLLNALFALSEGERDERIIKAAFEMRIMCLAGFFPMVEGCAVCGNPNPENPVLSGGVLYCAKCARGDYPPSKLFPGAIDAIRHITSVETRRVFSFRLGEDALKNLATVCEKYVREQLEMNFKTLDFYKTFKATAL